MDATDHKTITEVPAVGSLRRSASTTIRRMFVAGAMAATGLSFAASVEAATGPGCYSTSYHWCVRRGGTGSESYQLATNDADLGTNHYASGTTVGDHVGEGRNRWASGTVLCLFQHTNYQGSLRQSIPWAGTGWEWTWNTDVSSGYVKNGSTCP